MLLPNPRRFPVSPPTSRTPSSTVLDKVRVNSPTSFPSKVRKTSSPVRIEEAAEVASEAAEVVPEVAPDPQATDPRAADSRSRTSQSMRMPSPLYHEQLETKST